MGFWCNVLCAAGCGVACEGTEGILSVVAAAAAAGGASAAATSAAQGL